MRVRSEGRSDRKPGPEPRFPFRFAVTLTRERDFGYVDQVRFGASPGVVAVGLPDALVADLAMVSESLDDPVTDLEAILTVLTDDLLAAIPSYLGLTMTLYVDEYPLTVTTLDADSAALAGASMLLPLVPRGSNGLSGSPGRVVFFATADGAFIDLADDARWTFRLDGQVVLDRHLPPATAATGGIWGLTEFTEINQAVGVLIADGFIATEAHTELRRRATHQRQSLYEAAGQLLDGSLGGPAAIGGT